MDYGQVITLAVLGAGSLIVFLFLMRELWCWYWKINERNVLLRETNSLIRQNNPLLREISSQITFLQSVKVMSSGPVISAGQDQLSAPAEQALPSVPWGLQAAYDLWRANPTSENTTAFLSALKGARKKLPSNLTATQLQAMFPDIAGEADFAAVLEEN